MRRLRNASSAAAVAMALPAIAQDYFQQRIDYVIEARLDDERHELHAHETFVYTNRAPVALDTLWIHLWPNAYRDRGTALCEQLDRLGDLSLHFAEDAARGWIDSLDFHVGDSPASWGLHPRHADIGWIALPMPLQTGSAVTISTPFRVKVPDSRFSRLGHTGQAYHLTQWYPKPAVYDRHGWHAMPYLTQGEFFSEFGSYDVTITLPDNYVVGATGSLQTAEERDRMDRMASPEWLYPEPITDVRTGKPELNRFPASSPRMKTLRYVQDDVHDFAWFADKRFIVRKGSVTLPRSGRTVTTWALFTPMNAADWADAITYVNESVRLYSKWVGDYPYASCTALDGTISAGGGMEYPMVTIIGEASGAALDEVIAHEVGHNWFYGILGSNERDHAWMDEGLNSFLELRYMRTRYPGRKSIIAEGIPGFLLGGRNVGQREALELGYRLNARRNLDQPLCLRSDAFTSSNYGTGVYMKTALAFDHLMAYLGEETMDRCLQAYFNEWKFKHPRPEDLQRVFERESDKDLGWLFQGFLSTDEKYAVKAVSLDRRSRNGTEDRLHLGHRAKGPSDVPFSITGYLGGDSLGTVWDRNHGSGHQGRTEYAQLPWPDVELVRIDAAQRTLDIDRRDNQVRAHGLFKRRATLRLRPLFGLEQDDARTVYYAPVPAWNGHDGWQVGVVAHNMGYPPRRTEWVLAPLQAFGSERIVGAARIEHHFDRIRSSVFRNIHIGLSLRSASTLHDNRASAWYEKVAPSVRFDLKRDPLTKPWSHSITLRGVRIHSAAAVVGTDGARYAYRSWDDYLELRHTATDTRKLHPSAITTTLTAGEDWMRGSLEAEQAFAYNARNKQVRLRAFAGTFLIQPEALAPLEAWRLSWGPQDLLFDHAYFERGARDRFFSRQFIKQQGAFKTPMLQGGSDSWLVAFNAEVDFPFKFPLAAFASAGWAPVTTVTPEGRSEGTAGYAEAGIGLPLVKDLLEVWVPLYVSSRIADEEAFLRKGIGDRIRFVLALHQLDPTRIMRRIRP